MKLPAAARVRAFEYTVRVLVVFGARAEDPRAVILPG